MKILLIFDQGLAGAGGKSNPNVGLEAKKGGVGSALMMEPHFNKIGGNILATLYCGNEFFLDHQEEVIMKMTAMAKKLNPDFVVCGPCFNFLDYGKMSAMISKNILEKTDLKSCAMMSVENEATIEQYRHDVPIIKMPKKGGTGLNESLDHLCEFIDATLNHPEKVEELKKEICY